MIRGSFDVLRWLGDLFDAPPLASLSFRQKAGRVFLITATLVIGSILVAMFGALGLFLMEKGREMGSTPEFLNGVCIVLVGMSVNAACVFILLQLKRVDHKLVPPANPSGTPAVLLEVSPEQLKASAEKGVPEKN
jgi:hypothetical protein